VTPLPPAEGPHDDDISLFGLLAKGRSRAALEAVLAEPCRQTILAKRLKITDQAVAPVVSELERAGLVVRDAPRGKLRAADPSRLKALLIAEADLAAVINAGKSARATRRLRRLEDVGAREVGLEDRDAGSTVVTPLSRQRQRRSR
jgi:DNA-binding HxlR family transcriptional regulator